MFLHNHHPYNTSAWNFHNTLILKISNFETNLFLKLIGGKSLTLIVKTSTFFKTMELQGKNTRVGYSYEKAKLNWALLFNG